MKIVVFGQEPIIQRLRVLLAADGIEVRGAMCGLNAAADLHRQNGAVLAIVDATAAEAEPTCRYIHDSWGIPLVLILEDKTQDWKRLGTLNASAYITVNAGNGELAARLNALLRRFWPAQNRNHADSAALENTRDYKLNAGESSITGSTGWRAG